MAKVVGYVALLYGREFLGYAIRSIIDYVDVLYVLYTPQGSHGARVENPCPETRNELFEIASYAAGNKLVWHEGTYAHEGEHRGKILELCPDADMIIRIDSDEVYPEETIHEIVRRAKETPPDVAYIRVPFVHFYRSFNWAVINDASWPMVITFPQKPQGETAWADLKPVCHFGYAQSPMIVEWKQHIHGHRAEWRWEEDWFHNIFMTNRHEDCHPTNKDFWTAVRVNPLDYMPTWMMSHPYARVEVIE